MPPDIFSTNGGAMDGAMYSDYPMPPQAVAGGRGGAQYWLPYDAYMPQQTFDVPTNVSKGKQKKLANQNIQDYYRQLEATSGNVRNRALQEILQRMNVPMENLVAAQGVDAAAQNYGQNQGQLAAALASRGLIGSGAEDIESRQNMISYLSNIGKAQLQARNVEDARRQASLQDLLNLSKQDVQFYDAMRTGTLPSSPPNYHAADYYQLMKGVGTLVKSVASMGAGAAAGGGAGGFSAGADTGGVSQMMGQGGGGAFGGYSGFGGGGIGGGSETYGSMYGNFGGGFGGGGGGGFSSMFGG